MRVIGSWVVENEESCRVVTIIDIPKKEDAVRLSCDLKNKCLKWYYSKIKGEQDDPT